jgi:hypothetical protein
LKSNQTGNTVWIIGRTQVNSPEDGTNVVVPLEKKYILTPLSACLYWPKEDMLNGMWTPPPVKKM